jgi:hypothetical protein
MYHAAFGEFIARMADRSNVRESTGAKTLEGLLFSAVAACSHSVQ